MARFIAHRGNLWGARPEYENTVDYLMLAWQVCGAVECDVQWHKDELWLGHDEPQEPLPTHVRTLKDWFFHAKDLESLTYMMDRGMHCFWHQQDTITLTSKGYIWCYPGYHPVSSKSIWLDLHNKPVPQRIKSRCWGICGDNIHNVDRSK